MQISVCIITKHFTSVGPHKAKQGSDGDVSTVTVQGQNNKIKNSMGDFQIFTPKTSGP